MAKRTRLASVGRASEARPSSLRERIAWRDFRSGKFVQVEHVPGGPYRVFTKAGNISITSKLPKKVRRQLVAFLPSPARRPRHPRSGRFISAGEERRLSKMTITDADIRRIIQTSPKFKKSIARVRKGKKAKARRAMAYYLKKYLRDVKRRAAAQQKADAP